MSALLTLLPIVISGSPICYNAPTILLGGVRSGIMKHFFSLNVLFAAFLLASCGGGQLLRIPAPPIVASITVFAPSVMLKVGQTYQYTSVAKDIDGHALNGIAVTWSTSHPEVATIDLAGLALAVSEGVTTVTAARDGSTSHSVTLIVTSAPVSPVVPPVISLETPPVL